MTPLRYEQLRDAAGTDLGASRWIDVDQDRIDAFAAVSEDNQWIHVDRQRAASSELGTTIAHGYLTLSLVGTLLGDLLHVEPGLVMVNYGLDRVRFTAPVTAGSRLRARAAVAEVTESEAGLRLRLDAAGEVSGRPTPSCYATALILVRRG